MEERQPSVLIATCLGSASYDLSRETTNQVECDTYGSNDLVLI